MNTLADPSINKEAGTPKAQRSTPVWIRRLQDKGLLPTSERPVGTICEPERVVHLIDAEPPRVTSDAAIEVKWPAEIHVLRSRQEAQVSFWEKLPDWRVVAILLFWFFLVWLWLSYLVPAKCPYDSSIELNPAGIPVSVSLAYPEYIAVDDQGYIDVTIQNVSTQTISGAVVIDFSDVHIIRVNESKTNGVQFRDLAPRMKQTSRIGFAINEPPRFYRIQQEPAGFEVMVVDADGNEAMGFSGETQTINIAPVPGLRSGLASGGVIGGIISGIVAGLVTLPADWMKKRWIKGN